MYCNNLYFLVFEFEVISSTQFFLSGRHLLSEVLLEFGYGIKGIQIRLFIIIINYCHKSKEGK